MIMPENNIKRLGNFESKRNDRYEDYNFKNLITQCGTIFTSISITQYRWIKLMELSTPGKRFLKDMLTSHLKKYLQLEKK